MGSFFVKFFVFVNLGFSGEPIFSHTSNPFCANRAYALIGKDEIRDTSDESWFDERISALKHFIQQKVDLLNVRSNHQLKGGDDSYISRLKKDLERTRS
ncbi:MAG: hypothetical protein HQL32_02025 [Planctomycetes bacterium]|nr:hypothetical protein [Planctomycetota bacterium]